MIKLLDLRYDDAERKFIRMTVHGWRDFPPMPFNYHPDDRAPLTQVVKKMLAEAQYKIMDYVPPKDKEPEDIVAKLIARIEALEAKLRQ